MHISYTCENGIQTIATWPSMALLHWLMRYLPSNSPEVLEPLKGYVDNIHSPKDDDPMLLTLVYAQIECQWNKSPPFEIVRSIPNEIHGGQTFQAQCLNVLRWLHSDANITRLSVLEDY